jgi:Arc/MetJ family transcription regulator
MRTNIDIDDELIVRAMQAGPYKTKKDAVEAGLQLLARQAAYREVLKWEGRLRWEGDESIDWTQPDANASPMDEHRVNEPSPPPYLAQSRARAGRQPTKQTAKPVAKDAPRGRR